MLRAQAADGNVRKWEQYVGTHMCVNQPSRHTLRLCMHLQLPKRKKVCFSFLFLYVDALE
jgi:hypothetical protein